MSENAIFLIEGGKALELIKTHIAEKVELAAKIKAIADEFGTTNVATSKHDGSLLGLRLGSRDVRHKDFTAPDEHGICRPRKKSATAKRFAEIGGYTKPADMIAKAFGIPTAISYKKDGEYSGSRAIGSPFFPCGFLYLSHEGPFAMWTPDVELEVQLTLAREPGVEVAEPARSFRLDIEGCRRLEPEEWQIIALTHTLMRKQSEGQLVSQRRENMAGAVVTA